MVECHTIQGHAVRIELIEVKPQRYRWSWTIDGSLPSRSPNVLMRRDEARSEALLYVQWAIARAGSRGVLPRRSVG